MNFGLFKSILSQQAFGGSSFYLVHYEYCEIHFSIRFIICVNNLGVFIRFLLIWKGKMSNIFWIKFGSSDRGAKVSGVLVYDETPSNYYSRSLVLLVGQLYLKGS
jgi:hypothetical protein